MKAKSTTLFIRAAVMLLLGCSHAAVAQTFSTGSTGADGPLNITTSTNVTVRPGGVYNYTTVNIASGQTLRYFRNSDNAPIVILATGDVTISGTIDVSGSPGAAPGFAQSAPTPGGAGGPGGFNGGFAGFVTSNPPINVLPTAGQGPAGGAAASTSAGGQSGGYGAPTAFVALTPLFGGSGGGGGANGAPGGGAGSGSGGGGAILIASSTRIIINGTIRANGAAASTNFNVNCNMQPGAGAGGGIRLVAPDISGSGILQAIRGAMATACGQPQATDGRIRVEAFTTAGFTGSATPVASVGNAPGPVSAAGNPQLSNVPTLAITSVGGVAVPTTPSASYSTPDVTLAAGTSNPVPVVLSATNTPVGSPTAITVRLIPQGTASAVTVASTDHTGSFASSTATANITLPTGQVTVLQAHAAMTLTGQTASLFPLIDGEPVERVLVATTAGEPSSVSLLTKSGRAVRVDELTAEDQLRVARAWDALRGLN